MQKLTTYILVAMLLGIGVGWMCHELWPDPATARSISGYISLFTDIFLRLIKMIIAPLVFSTLVVGRRAHGRHQVGGADRRQGDAVVRLRLLGVAAARPRAGEPPAARRAT